MHKRAPLVHVVEVAMRNLTRVVFVAVVSGQNSAELRFHESDGISRRWQEEARGKSIPILADANIDRLVGVGILEDVARRCKLHEGVHRCMVISVERENSRQIEQCRNDDHEDRDECRVVEVMRRCVDFNDRCSDSEEYLLCDVDCDGTAEADEGVDGEQETLFLMRLYHHHSQPEIERRKAQIVGKGQGRLLRFRWHCKVSNGDR